MSGIDKITERIRSEADSKSAQALAEAEFEAKKTIKSFEDEAAKQTREIVRRGMVQADERKERLAGVAELEARKNVLAAKQEVLDDVFGRAAEAVVALPDKKYISLLAKLATRSSRTGTERILLSENDFSRFGDKVIAAANAEQASLGKPALLTLSDITADIDGGLIVKEGDVEVNCAIKTIVHFMREKISAEVADILFSESKTLHSEA
jgi:V/A-type H+-transporting ATPase subunit E